MMLYITVDAAAKKQQLIQHFLKKSEKNTFQVNTLRPVAI
jgi:hypothetical protein